MSYFQRIFSVTVLQVAALKNNHLLKQSNLIGDGLKVSKIFSCCFFGWVLLMFLVSWLFVFIGIRDVSRFLKICLIYFIV